MATLRAETLIVAPGLRLCGCRGAAGQEPLLNRPLFCGAQLRLGAGRLHQNLDGLCLVITITIKLEGRSLHCSVCEMGELSLRASVSGLGAHDTVRVRRE